MCGYCGAIYEVTIKVLRPPQIQGRCVQPERLIVVPQGKHAA